MPDGRDTSSEEELDSDSSAGLAGQEHATAAAGAKSQPARREPSARAAQATSRRKTPLHHVLLFLFLLGGAAAIAIFISECIGPTPNPDRSAYCKHCDQATCNCDPEERRLRNAMCNLMTNAEFSECVTLETSGSEAAGLRQCVERKAATNQVIAELLKRPIGKDVWRAFEQQCGIVPRTNSEQVVSELSQQVARRVSELERLKNLRAEGRPNPAMEAALRNTMLELERDLGQIDADPTHGQLSVSFRIHRMASRASAMIVAAELSAGQDRPRRAEKAIRHAKAAQTLIAFAKSAQGMQQPGGQARAKAIRESDVLPWTDWVVLYASAITRTDVCDVAQLNQRLRDAYPRFYAEHHPEADDVVFKALAEADGGCSERPG